MTPSLSLIFCWSTVETFGRDELRSRTRVHDTRGVGQRTSSASTSIRQRLRSLQKYVDHSPRRLVRDWGNETRLLVRDHLQPNLLMSSFFFGRYVRDPKDMEGSTHIVLHVARALAEAAAEGSTEE